MEPACFIHHQSSLGRDRRDGAIEEGRLLRARDFSERSRRLALYVEMNLGIFIQPCVFTSSSTSAYYTVLARSATRFEKIGHSFPTIPYNWHNFNLRY